MAARISQCISDDIGMEKQEKLDEYSDQERCLLFKVAQANGAHFKSQQMDEPDLTLEEKMSIASEILRNKGAGAFLRRFSKFLDDKDVVFFSQHPQDYEVQFYLNEISSRCSRKRNFQVKNRRFEALKRLVKAGKYFSDSEAKERNPLLYEQLVFKHLTDEEKAQLDQIDEADLRLTTILLDHIERDHIGSFRRQQQEAEFQEEFDDDDDDDYDYNNSDEGGNGHAVSEAEKKLLREEFVTTMYQSFLDGKDEFFDYGTVDDNAEYDSLDTLGRDEEENYFDSEEPLFVERCDYNDDDTSPVDF